MTPEVVFSALVARWSIGPLPSCFFGATENINGLKSVRFGEFMQPLFIHNGIAEEMLAKPLEGDVSRKYFYSSIAFKIRFGLKAVR